MKAASDLNGKLLKAGMDLEIVKAWANSNRKNQLPLDEVAQQLRGTKAYAAYYKGRDPPSQKSLRDRYNNLTSRNKDNVQSMQAKVADMSRDFSQRFDEANAERLN